MHPEEYTHMPVIYRYDITEEGGFSSGSGSQHRNCWWKNGLGEDEKYCSYLTSNHSREYPKGPLDSRSNHG